MRNRVLILTALGAIMLIAFSLFVPNFIRARSTRAKNACIANLRQLDGAKEQWILESRPQTNTVVTFETLKDYLSGREMRCPDGGEYRVGYVGEKPRCSIGGREHSIR